MSRRSRQRRYEARDPWWMLEYGGAPVWMIIAVLAVIAAVGVVVVRHLS